jgi:hypothetical protein
LDPVLILEVECIDFRKTKNSSVLLRMRTGKISIHTWMYLYRTECGKVSSRISMC